MVIRVGTFGARRAMSKGWTGDFREEVSLIGGDEYRAEVAQDC
jgi:hypothetical protein